MRHISGKLFVRSVVFVDAPHQRALRRLVGFLIGQQAIEKVAWKIDHDVTFIPFARCSLQKPFLLALFAVRCHPFGKNPECVGQVELAQRTQALAIAFGQRLASG